MPKKPKEYIEREVLLKAVEKMDRLDKETKLPYKYDKQGYLILINIAPTADVVEVVRCKDCIYYKGKNYCVHDFGLNLLREDDFCSYGKRKDNDK